MQSNPLNSSALLGPVFLNFDNQIGTVQTSISRIYACFNLEQTRSDKTLGGLLKTNDSYLFFKNVFHALLPPQRVEFFLGDVRGPLDDFAARFVVFPISELALLAAVSGKKAPGSKSGVQSGNGSLSTS